MAHRSEVRGLLATVSGKGLVRLVLLLIPLIGGVVVVTAITSDDLLLPILLAIVSVVNGMWWGRLWHQRRRGQVEEASKQSNKVAGAAD